MNQENRINESWEDIDESELEERLDKEKQERLKKEQEMASTATNQQNGISLLSNGSADEFRPRVLQRPSPKVTILKRPESSASSPQASSAQLAANRTQIKSLEQREKEYAEARLRILGSATDTTIVNEDQNNPIRFNQQKPSTQSLNSSTAYYSQQSENSSHLMQNQQLKPLDPPENVVRLPRGPSGQGFNIRR